VGELGELRNEMFGHLVEHEGYRSFAIESDCLMGLLVDDYISTGAGTLDDVMRLGFSHGFGRSPANRDLVRWMRTARFPAPSSPAKPSTRCWARTTGGRTRPRPWIRPSRSAGPLAPGDCG
jgi:erythromycin esterase-like protein